MSNLIAFPRHKLFRWRSFTRQCLTCGGVNKSLPTHCPGVPMDLVTRLAIKSGELDFVNGEWKHHVKSGGRSLTYIQDDCFDGEN